MPISVQLRWPLTALTCALLTVCLQNVPGAAQAQDSKPAAQKEQKQQGRADDPEAAPELSKKDRTRGHEMLKEIKGDIKKYYYDPQFRGIDLDARFKLAHEKVDAAQSLGQMFGVIAQLLVEFEDSHTFFMPPRRHLHTVYGWSMAMIGDDCFVTDVEKGSDAEGKGLKRGDKIVQVGGFIPVRDNFWKLSYLFKILRPQPALYVFAQSPGQAQPRPLTLVAQVEEADIFEELFGEQEKEEREPPKDDPERETHFGEHRFYEFKAGPVVWQMPEFDLSEGALDRLMKEKVAPHPALILDLRDNRGGYEVTLLRLLANVLPHDVKVGDIQRRRGVKQLNVKSREGKAYSGQLVVLVNSQSASSAELFARMIQLEKRGVVIGDRTAGAVMRALQLFHVLDDHSMMGVYSLNGFGVSVTDADLVMTDGRSLERTGVTPDELLLPTAEDLAARRDPVLARAAELVGVKLEPEKAGTLFPPREPKRKPAKKDKDKKSKEKTKDEKEVKGGESKDVGAQT